MVFFYRNECGNTYSLLGCAPFARNIMFYYCVTQIQTHALEAGKKVGRSRVFPFACTNFIQDGLCLRLTKKLTNIDMFACYTCI